MANPCFLDMDRVIRTHRSLMEAYGGIDGVRDAALLHSAIALPQASFGGQYLHADLFQNGGRVPVPHRAEPSVS